MKWVVAIIYISFIALIALSVYWTKSAWPLFALIFTPTVNDKAE